MVSLERALKIDGWMSREELEWLATMAKSCPFIVEIGSHKGRSTAALVDNTTGGVVAVDTWADEAVFQEFIKHNKKKAIVYRTDSLTAAKMLTLPGGADFIFIDADHSYEAVRADIAAWRRRLVPGGLIAGHDYDAHWPGVMRAVDEAYPGRLRGAGSIWYVRV
jgi:predicted O-methyltransferase YrrM